MMRAEARSLRNIFTKYFSPMHSARMVSRKDFPCSCLYFLRLAKVRWANSPPYYQPKITDTVLKF